MSEHNKLLRHERSCPAWEDPHGYECGEPCTCGLIYRRKIKRLQEIIASMKEKILFLNAKLK